jgi:putative transposase
MVHAAHLEGRRNDGRPMIHEALKKRGIRISAKRVGQLMCEQGIQGKVRQGFVRTTDSNHTMPVFENLLNRNFTATGPNQRWVGHITYLRSPNGFIYLAVVMDVFLKSHRRLGGECGHRPTRGHRSARDSAEAALPRPGAPVP